MDAKTRENIRDATVKICQEHSDLENFKHRTMQYVNMILTNEDSYKLDSLVVSQLKAILKLGGNG